MSFSMQQMDWLSLILAVVSGLVWAVRLEGRLNFSQKHIDRVDQEVRELKVRHETLDSELVRKLSRLETSIARIEGYLKRSVEDEKGDS